MTKQIRRYKCAECHNVVTENWMRKQARQLNRVIEYTSPCPKCGCPEWIQVRKT